VTGLFPELEGSRHDAPGADAPLAERMRPRTLDEVAGLEDVVGPTGLLRRALEEDRIGSLIFWGPPGSGKTTLARLVARHTKARYVAYSAVTSGIKEVKQIMEEAAELRRRDGRRTLLFVDEIHRFNRAQQDAFLPYVERGDIILVGATTENPSFEVNAALLSRVRVVVLSPLSDAAMERVVSRAVADPERGLGARGIRLEPDAVAFLVAFASGDARRALGLLEHVAAEVADGASVDRSRCQSVGQRKIPRYDKAGEEHFNVISALHKSMRSSDPQAAIYWLARMLEAGEDPLYVARRIVRFASEDVGLADPQALPICLAARDAVDFLGMPEGALALAEAAVYCATAPKSDALYRGYGRARAAVADRPAEPVPMAIRNAVTSLMRSAGYGAGYRHAHDDPEGAAAMDCLPEGLAGERFYEPASRGFEREIGKRMAYWDRVRAARATGAPAEEP
jgi:putative ATPase